MNLSELLSSSQTHGFDNPMISCECRNDRVITDHQSGEVICSNCGLVVSDGVEEAYASLTVDTIYGKMRHVGPPNSLARHDLGLSTIIGKPNMDAAGHILDGATHSRMERLRMWDLRIKASDDRTLRDGLTHLNTLKDKLGLHDAAVETAAHIYRKARERGLLRGRTISAVLGAALYVACRETGMSKTLKELAEAYNIKRKTLAKSYRLLISELDIKIPIINPIQCVVKISNNANINEKTKRKAMDVMHHLVTTQIAAGKDPMGIAATALYIACLNTGEKRTQTNIAQAAGVTEVTLRNRYRDIKSRGCV